MFIYLIQKDNSNHYKIGISNDVKERLKGLQTSNSEKLILKESFETKFDFKLEKYLHRRFNSNKILGEWFELTLEDVKLFKETCQKAESNFKLLKEQNTYTQKYNKL